MDIFTSRPLHASSVNLSPSLSFALAYEYRTSYPLTTTVQFLTVGITFPPRLYLPTSPSLSFYQEICRDNSYSSSYFQFGDCSIVLTHLHCTTLEARKPRKKGRKKGRKKSPSGVFLARTFEMGWNPSPTLISTAFDHDNNVQRQQQQQSQPSRRVKQLLEDYRRRCISTCLLYPTFRSSSVIMTLGTVRRVPPAHARLGLPSPNVRSGEKEETEEEGWSLPPPPPAPPSPSPRKADGSAFLRFWWTKGTREAFLNQVPSEDLGTFRRACHDFGVRAAPILFEHLTITFRASTFTKPARMAALERIGHHVRSLTFQMPHTTETFLAPLLSPTTGAERSFVYEPQTAGPSRPAMAGPKYGSWEMTDLLTKQYGPLFHAATNVPAFVRALTAMSGISHLGISCPDQEPSHRYRRSAVDYALISLRMAVERAPLVNLKTLSLTPMHAGGLLYLRSEMGFGSSPKGARRWAQIEGLTIQLDSWAFDAPNGGTDHLKLLHQYLLSFSARLQRLSFRWRGAKGPCPYTLDSEPVLQQPRSSLTRIGRIRFRRLRQAQLANAYPDASQLNRFIHRHRHSLRECDFDEVELRSGDWDEALSVLTRISGNDRWRHEQVALESARSSTTSGGSIDEAIPPAQAVHCLTPGCGDYFQGCSSKSRRHGDDGR